MIDSSTVGGRLTGSKVTTLRGRRACERGSVAYGRDPGPPALPLPTSWVEAVFDSVNARVIARSENWEGAEVLLWSAVGVIVVGAAGLHATPNGVVLLMSLTAAALVSGSEIRIGRLGPNTVVGSVEPVGSLCAAVTTEAR